MAKILFVDDEVALLDAIRRALRKEPYEFFYATSGLEALKILSDNEDMDLIVSDESMPGMTGVEFFKVCRTEYPEAVRIILTGKTDVDSAMKAIFHGWVYQYLHKPVNASDLAATIHNALILKNLRKAGESPHILMPPDSQRLLLEKATKTSGRVVVKWRSADSAEDNSPADIETLTPREAISNIRSIIAALTGADAKLWLTKQIEDILSRVEEER